MENQKHTYIKPRLRSTELSADNLLAAQSMGAAVDDSQTKDAGEEGSDLPAKSWQLDWDE